MPNELYNLFALTSIPEARVMRIPVVQELQHTITGLFQEQEQQFFAGVGESDYYKFDGRYRPEERELLYIEDFDDIDGLAAAIKSPLSVQEFPTDSEVLTKIKGIFSGYIGDDGTANVFIQTFERKRVISPKGFSIIHGADKFKRFEGSGMTLDNKLAAVLNGKKLMFPNFHLLRQVFDMSSYYRDATDADVKELCGLAAEDPKTKAFLETCDSWIRRKIGLIKQSGILEKATPESIVKVALNFDIKVNISVVDGKSKIDFPDSRAELKRLLRFLDEDYYQSPLTDTRYISNSKTAAQ